MKKNTIRLNENQLKRLIKESVRKVVREEYDSYDSEEDPYEYPEQCLREDPHDKVWENISNNGGMRFEAEIYGMGTLKVWADKLDEEWGFEESDDWYGKFVILRLYPDYRRQKLGYEETLQDAQQKIHDYVEKTIFDFNREMEIRRREMVGRYGMNESSVMETLEEGGIFRKPVSLSNDGDSEMCVKDAIHELSETVSILKKFLDGGMKEKRLFEMASVYFQRGHSAMKNLIEMVR